jgi:hypothetical protein
MKEIIETPNVSSPSLRSEIVIGPNGAVTTSTALRANEKWGIGDTKRVERVTDGVYAMRGWGIGSVFAVEAPDGWIVIETGDSTKAAAEMRAMLEEALGRKIKVAAILLTHWHYGEGTGAWLDEGAEVWGHEHLDRNRSVSTGLSVLGVPSTQEGPRSSASSIRQAASTPFRTSSALRSRN